MKKTQLVISGVCLLIAGIGSATAAGSFEAFDGSLYNDLQAQQQEQDMTTATRGAQGPIRSDNDTATDQKRAEWHKMLGPFDGSAD